MLTRGKIEYLCHTRDDHFFTSTSRLGVTAGPYILVFGNHGRGRNLAIAKDYAKTFTPGQVERALAMSPSGQTRPSGRRRDTSA